MSDWAVGDLAVCVGGGDWFEEDTDERVPGPESGFTAKVIGVKYDREYETDKLLFCEWPHPRGWAAGCFRKIRPDEHEACETEFVTLLKRSKRKVSA